MKQFLQLSIIFLILLLNFQSIGKPVADFTASAISGCSPLSVTFSDMSSGIPTSWTWDFGNGQTSHLQNPNVTFINPGKYSITLIVTNSSGSDTKLKTQYITVYKNPTADFQVDNQIGCINKSRNFTDKSTAGDGVINSWYWDFGDGENDNTKNSAHAFSNVGLYNIMLRITDIHGCVSSISKKNFMDIKSVKADFNVNETYFCKIPATTVFTNKSTPVSSIIQYSWDFGNGHTSSLSNPSENYTNNGKYTVKLRVDDQFGCYDEVVRTNYIEVENFNTDFDYTYLDSCVPARLTFSNKSNKFSGISYYWDFGDNTTSKDENPYKTYVNSGSYNVRLFISKNNCISDKTKNIQIYSVADMIFVADTVKFCKIPFIAGFSVNATGSYSFLWDFGDKTTSALQNPAHTYNSFGTFTVKLTVTDLKTGCVRTFIRTNYIKSYPPGVKVELKNVQGCVPLVVDYVITDTSLVPLTSWKVSSGDGQNSSLKFGYFIYPDTGIFKFNIIGKNANGCEFIYTQDIKAGMPPVADFQDLKYKGCNDTMLQFTNLTNTHNPKAEGFFWQFGDDEESGEINPKHKYQDTGFMDVKLIAFKYGCSDTFIREKMLYIFSPVAKLKDKALCFPEELMNYNNSIGGTNWFWDFGDNSYSNLQFPVHKYNLGVYKIKLKLQDQHTNCTDYDSAIIHVIKAPEDNIISDKTWGCKGAVINFTDTSTKNLNYFWRFSNNQTSILKSPSISFNSGGHFSVNLFIKDSNNCSLMIIKNDLIKISGIVPDFTSSDYAGCVPLTIQLKDISTSIFPIRQRKWDFGNSKTLISAGKDTSYTYLKAFSGPKQSSGFQLILSLTDSLGCAATTYQTIVPAEPKADFNLKLIDNCLKTQVNFTAYTNDTAAINPVSASWFLNNIPASNKTSFSKSFSGDSLLKIRLILKDAFGCADTAEKNIKISNDPPVSDFSYIINSSSNHCPPVVVKFTNKSIPGKNQITHFYWDFGNNSFSSKENPTNSYLEPGIYTVSLVVTDEVGCSDTMKKYNLVKVNGAIGNFSVEPLVGCGSLSCNFTPHTTKVSAYNWNFGDGNASSDSVPTHKYTYGGVFRPLVVLTDTLGCMTSITTKDTIIVWNNPKAEFKINGKLTCLGNFTRFINLSRFDHTITKWEWNFGNGTFSSLFEPSLSYQDTGKYTVSLKVTDTMGCSDSVSHADLVKIYYDSIRPEPPYLYKISYLLDPQLDDIIFSQNTNPDFRNYRIFRTDNMANIQSFFDMPEDQRDSVVIDTISASVIPQCYYLNSYDYCNNISYPSRLHCLIFLQAKALNTGNYIYWTPYKGWNKLEKYSVYRKRPSKQNDFTLIANVDSNTTSYNDTDVVCSELYSYYVLAFEKDGHHQYSMSNPDSVKSVKIMNIDAVKLNRASVENEKILIEWQKEMLNYDFKYIIYRTKLNNNEEFIAYSDCQSDHFRDTNVNCQEFSYKYRIKILQKGCNYYGKPSNPAKSILLKIPADSIISDRLKLSWTPYVYWPEGVDHYEIEYLNSKTRQFELVGISDSNITSFYHTFDSFVLKHYYKVKAVQKNRPEIVSNSNIASYIITPRVTIPNSFSPNGDGKNDYFFPVCYGGKILDFQVYDRWGEKVYESSAPSANWDGNYKSKSCESGVYFYMVSIEIEKNTRIFTGSVSLLR